MAAEPMPQWASQLTQSMTTLTGQVGGIANTMATKEQVSQIASKLADMENRMGKVEQSHTQHVQQVEERMQSMQRDMQRDVQLVRWQADSKAHKAERRMVQAQRVISVGWGKERPEGLTVTSLKAALGDSVQDVRAMGRRFAVDLAAGVTSEQLRKRLQEKQPDWGLSVKPMQTETERERAAAAHAVREAASSLELSFWLDHGGVLWVHQGENAAADSPNWVTYPLWLHMPVLGEPIHLDAEVIAAYAAEVLMSKTGGDNSGGGRNGAAGAYAGRPKRQDPPEQQTPAFARMSNRARSKSPTAGQQQGGVDGSSNNRVRRNSGDSDGRGGSAGVAGGRRGGGGGSRGRFGSRGGRLG